MGFAEIFFLLFGFLIAATIVFGAVMLIILAINRAKQRKTTAKMALWPAIIIYGVVMVCFFSTVIIVSSSRNISRVNADNVNEEILTFRGEMNLEIEQNTAKMTVSSNVPDGGVFELAIMNNDLEILSDFVPIKDGKIIKEFNIPNDWGVGYISGLALFKFDTPDYSQPDNIKEIYGENGKNMEGELTTNNSIGGKNASIKTVIEPYPDKETVASRQDETLHMVLGEVIDKSNGTILQIRPYGDNWSMIKVIIGDGWYYLQDYQKERFAEQSAELVEMIVKKSGKVNMDKTVGVFFYDRYNKELASPKMLGGYKILR